MLDILLIWTWGFRYSLKKGNKMRGLVLKKEVTQPLHIKDLFHAFSVFSDQVFLLQCFLGKCSFSWKYVLLSYNVNAPFSQFSRCWLLFLDYSLPLKHWEFHSKPIYLFNIFGGKNNTMAFKSCCDLCFHALIIGFYFICLATVYNGRIVVLLMSVEGALVVVLTREMNRQRRGLSGGTGW